jgi:hypothetical protein
MQYALWNDLEAMTQIYRNLFQSHGLLAASIHDLPQSLSIVGVDADSMADVA